MHKKYHEKFKILGILAVTTQAREGIETPPNYPHTQTHLVTTQAREGIETLVFYVLDYIRSLRNNSSP